MGQPDRPVAVMHADGTIDDKVKDPLTDKVIPQ
jgi:hypothetical protein